MKVLGTFESSSSSRIYEVRLGDDNIVWCQCAGWRFQKLPKGERSCGHMKKLGLRGDSYLATSTPGTARSSRAGGSDIDSAPQSKSQIRAAEEKVKREKKGAETKARMKELPYEFMLSHKYRESDWKSNSEYVLEIKYDGALTMFADGRLYSRRGHDITHRFPELDLDFKGVIIGELAVVDEKSKLTVFKRLLTRNTDDKLKIRAAANEHPVTFFAFDMLHAAGVDISTEQFGFRRRLLEEWFETHQPKGWKLVDQIPVDSPEKVQKALSKAAELNMEGLMLKPLNGRYVAGKRTRDWMKVKVWKDGVFTITSHGPTGIGDGYVITVDANGIEQEVNCGSYQMREQLASGKKFKADIQYQRIDKESGRLRFPTLKRLVK